MKKVPVAAGRNSCRVLSGATLREAVARSGICSGGLAVRLRGRHRRTGVGVAQVLSWNKALQQLIIAGSHALAHEDPIHAAFGLRFTLDDVELLGHKL